MRERGYVTVVLQRPVVLCGRASGASCADGTKRGWVHEHVGDRIRLEVSAVGNRVDVVEPSGGTLVLVMALATDIGSLGHGVRRQGLCDTEAPGIRIGDFVVVVCVRGNADACA